MPENGDRLFIEILKRGASPPTTSVYSVNGIYDSITDGITTPMEIGNG
jgi:hypothetical protein